MSESPRDIDDLGLDELKTLLVQALEEIAGLKREVRALREEIARLKGLKGKPDIKPNIKPSGMEKNAKPRSGKKNGGKKPVARGSKNDKLVIDETKIFKPDSVAEGSKFKSLPRTPIRGL